MNIDDIKYIGVCRYTKSLIDALTPPDECFRLCGEMCDIDNKKCEVREFAPLNLDNVIPVGPEPSCKTWLRNQ